MGLASAMEWLRDQQLASDGEPITYTRGDTTLPLTAVPGRTPFRTNDENGRALIVRSDKDFKLDPATLGVLVEPLEGDRIVHAGETYEVYATIVGEPCWRPCDDYNLMIRIHTRKET